MREAEVLIVGGGVIGLGIARELHKRGITSIAVVDKGVCGGEASWAAAGMLGPQAETDETGAFYDLCTLSRDMYPTFAGELLDETGIDIELDRTGTLYLGFTDEDCAILHRRYKYQQEAGLDIEMLSQEEIVRYEPHVSVSVQSGLRFANDWQVDNRKLCEALAVYARSNNIEVNENINVERIVNENGRVQGVETNTGNISAKTVVLATGAWTSFIDVGETPLAFPVEPVRGQILEFTTSQRIFHHVIPHASRLYRSACGWPCAGRFDERECRFCQRGHGACPGAAWANG